jgi:hypothetical protein
MLPLERMTKFAQEKIQSKNIPADELQLVQLCSQPFYDMRHKSDFYSIGEHKASYRGFTRDWFILLHALDPSANSFLELGTGSGYIVRVALRLGYDAVGVEISDSYVNAAKESLEHFGYCSSRISKDDFLSDGFLDKEICGRPVEDFDVVHLWVIEKIVFRTLPRIIPKMKKASLLITGFEQPFYPDDISSYLADMNLPATVKGYSSGTFLLRRD